MFRRASIVFLVLLLAASGEARLRAVRHPSAARAVMWIAAHPDDEAVAAPLLAAWCLEADARCTFVVLTRGELGTCVLASGCVPDVKSMRSAEAGSASELFHADSVLLRYSDGGGASPPVWPEADLIAQIASLIETFQPDVILTFDPRHGTTCHPDHRETGRLVLEAVERLPDAPLLYLLETRVTVTAQPFGVTFTSAAAAAERFDATKTWDAIVRDMQRHPSQFAAELVAAIENVPAAERAVFIARAGEALQQSVETCP